MQEVGRGRRPKETRVIATATPMDKRGPILSSDEVCMDSSVQGGCTGAQTRRLTEAMGCEASCAVK